MENKIEGKTVIQLDKIAGESNCSRNERINLFLEHGLGNYKITE